MCLYAVDQSAIGPCVPPIGYWWRMVVAYPHPIRDDTLAHRSPVLFIYSAQFEQVLDRQCDEVKLFI